LNKFTQLLKPKYFVKLIVLVAFLGTGLVAHATHLIGGNMGYIYVGPDPAITGNSLYKITLDAYQDCNSTNWWSAGGVFPEGRINVGIYEGAYAPTAAISNSGSINLILTDSNEVDPNLPQICDPFNLLSTVCVYLVRYENTISLPSTTSGFWIIYDRCCRPGGITNLNDSGSQSFVYSTWIPSINGVLGVNTSAQFTDTLLSYICTTDTAYISNTAIDADGDSLVYSLVTPFIGITGNGAAGNNPPAIAYTSTLMDPYTIPPSGINYQTGYSLTNLLGTGSFSNIDPNTGLTRFYSNFRGTFAAAVEITEYRNNVIVGVTRRNMQLIADNCPNNNMPNQNISVLDSTAITPLDYEVDAGTNICFHLNYSDTDGDPLQFTASSPIFDNTITNPAATVTSPVNGVGAVTGTICWNTSCAQGRIAPYIVNVVVTDSNCPPLPLPQELKIYVRPFEGPKTIFGDTVVCVTNQATQFTADTLTNVVYNWTVTGGTITSGGNGPNIGVTWAAGQANGIISLTTTNQNGCIAGPITKNVVLSNVVSDAGGDQTMCVGIPVTIGGAPTSTDPGNTIKWSPSTGLNFDTLANPIANPNTSTTYIVSLTNTLGCVGTDTITVTVNQPIPSGILSDYFLCPGDTLPLNATGATFTWGPNVFISATNIANPKVYPPSNQTYTLQYFDINGCEGNDTSTVTVNATVPTDAGADSPICSGDSFSLGGNPTGPFGTTYNWQPTANMNNNTLANPSVLPTATTTYIVMTSNDTCTGIDSVTVTVIPSPTLSVSSDTYVCEGDSTQITATGTGSFLWSNGNTLSDSTISNPLAFPSVSTVYVVTLTDATSCESVDSVLVDIQGLPTASAGGLIDACKFNPTQIGGSPTGPPGATYSWTPITGLNSNTSANPMVTIDQDVTYIVQVTDSLGCVAHDTVAVEVFRIQGFGDTTICKNVQLNLNTRTIHGNGPYTYQWTNGSLLSDSTSGSPTVTSGTKAAFTVTVTDANNCKDTVDFNLNLLATTQSVFTYEILPTCEGVGVQITDNSIGAAGYAWLINDTLVSSSENPLLTFEYGKDANLKLVTTSSDGCVDTAEVTITGPKFTDLAEITISNVFTPNGDGENDYFEVTSNGNLSGCIEMTVFNRGGQLVYKSTGGISVWDGRSTTGQKYPDGVYYYVYSINGVEYHGNVMLMR
tara:strand:+ start:30204 stop:33734 length:3531 start_codon:yes stop_codon:yes gene_type:complete